MDFNFLLFSIVTNNYFKYFKNNIEKTLVYMHKNNLKN